jgi:hypothetical protein
MAAFPPIGQTSLTQILPAYVYKQYEDDENIQAFNDAYNGMAQSYLDFINALNLPIYTSASISGSLLDWVAAGIYGLVRPALPYGQIVGIGPLNTWTPNQIAVNSFQTSGVINNFTTTDDIFKRIITWFFFKGDGQQFSAPWLKRRVMRFLTGAAGTAPNIDNTYPVSVAFGGDGDVTVTVTLTVAAGITLANAQIFQAAVASGAISMPFQLTVSVTVVNNLGPTGLINNGGMLGITTATGYPTSATGLPAGAVWDNGGVAAVIPGMAPDPYATPLFYGLVTAAQLLTVGGGNLPLTNPGLGTGQLWNNGGFVWVA